MPNLIKIRDLLQQKPLLDQRETELLIAHVLKNSQEFILAHPEKTLNKLQIKKYNQLITKRQKNIPLAYLTGHKEFFGLDFIVNKNVLIPRPDTELMVELALQEIRTENSGLRTILIDIGTGSGCIPISILKNLENKNLTTFAIDISFQALNVARKNAKLHKTKMKFLHGDLLEPILSTSFPCRRESNNAKKDLRLRGDDVLIITANLPYLNEKQFKQESSIQHEPKLALVAKKNGLELYEKLLKQIKILVTSYQLPTTSYFEIDPSQTSAIKKLIKKYLPQAKIEIEKDLSRLDRLVIIRL